MSCVVSAVEEQREWTEMGVASSGDGSSDDEVDTLKLYKQIMETWGTLTKVCGVCVCVGVGVWCVVCVRVCGVWCVVCVEPLNNTT